jgi:hypothetical protein
MKKIHMLIWICGLFGRLLSIFNEFLFTPNILVFSSHVFSATFRASISLHIFQHLYSFKWAIFYCAVLNMALDSEPKDFYAIEVGCIRIKLLEILTWNSKFEAQRHIFSNCLFSESLLL